MSASVLPNLHIFDAYIFSISGGDVASEYQDREVQVILEANYLIPVHTPL